MPCLGCYDKGDDVFAEDEPGVIGPVKKEQEGMFRMLIGDPFQCFITEPSYTLEPVFKQ
jgi:hypothetical protein